MGGTTSCAHGSESPLTRRHGKYGAHVGIGGGDDDEQDKREARASHPMAPDGATTTFVRSMRAVRPWPALGPQGVRALFDDVQRAAYHPLWLAPAEISTLAIDDADCVESPITVHIVRPLDPQRPSRLPVVVYAHGGAGWTAGDMATHERFVRELCYLAGAAIVFVECARSPEAPWPIAERQVAGVVRWVAAHGRRIGVDPTRMALAGDDGGAHVAVSVALRLAHERRAYGDGRGDAYEGEPPATRHPLLSALVLFCPLVRPPPPPHEARGSWARFADGAWFTADAARWAWEAYAPEPSAADLLSVPDPDLRVLPPTLVIAAGRDPSADDALSLAERLEGAGVPSETAVWPHAIHDFVVLNPLACSPVASEAVERAARFLAEHILF